MIDNILVHEFKTETNGGKDSFPQVEGLRYDYNY